MIGVLGRLARPLRAGVEKTASRDPLLAAPRSITVTSAGFADGAPIPLRYLAFGDDVSPPIAWCGVPDEAVELVLIVEDADAPLPRPFVHAIASGIDPVSPGLAEGALHDYTGPGPVPGHGTHRYLFQVFALDARSGLGPRARRSTAVDAMADHVLAVGVLTGTCER